MSFTSLSHHIDVDWLKEAYRLTRKDGAVGIDGQTATEYASDLDARLQDLLARLKNGTYFAPPVRRAHIPKAGGKTRPIGIPTFEDKIAQRAVAMVLESVYEQDFLDCSYGFRPGRNAHQALSSFRDQMMRLRGGWVIELDIQSFFDELDHVCLREMLATRIRDGVLRRLIGKWLKAGVFEEGQLRKPTAGSPQGGVISPILANLYLHHVLDTWFHDVVLPRLAGRALLVRYADDAVIGFESEQDARRVLDVLPKRFAKFHLRLHPEKTRLVKFTRPLLGDPPKGSGRRQRPGTFDLLGFTHYWARSRKGNWIIRRKTQRSRLSRALQSVQQWCKTHRHAPLAYQQQTLNRKVQGHCAYYGLTGNGPSLKAYRTGVLRCWKKWLSRRSQKAYLDWPRFWRLLERYPIVPWRVVHSIYHPGANR